MSHRKPQLESALRRAIGQVLLAGLADPRVEGLISVTEVKVADDSQTAKVKVSVLPESKQAPVLAGLRHAASYIQTEVGRQLSIRRVPHLVFEIDPSLKTQARTLEAIRQAMEEDAARHPAEAPSDEPHEDSSP